MPRVNNIVPGAIVTNKATGATRTVVSVDGDEVFWRDHIGEGSCTRKGLRHWASRKPKWYRELEKQRRQQTIGEIQE